jgi:ABC-type transporter Mla subunit MlaD
MKPDPAFNAALDKALEQIKPAEPSIEDKLVYLAKLATTNERRIAALVERSNRQMGAIVELSNENAALSRQVLDLTKCVNQLVAAIDGLQEQRGDWYAGLQRRRWN